MKFFVTGVKGQLGFDVILELYNRGYTEVLGSGREDLDITDYEAVYNKLMNYRPDVIIHCAAYTKVDQAELDRESCYNVNVVGTENIVRCAKELGAKIIYISTDYVFDGTKDGIYNENDLVNPINYYGQTKYWGEEMVQTYYNHIIVRISWVFGINGNNFIKTMLRLAEVKKEIGVVCDQVGSPTYTEDLVKLLVDMAVSDKNGLYHATNEGYCSWYELAKFVFEINEIDMVVNDVLTKDYKTTALRPLNSRLDKSKLVSDGFLELPHWKDAVKRYCKVLKKAGD